MGINEDLAGLRADISSGDSGHVEDHLKIGRIVKDLKSISDADSMKISRINRAMNPYPKLSGLGDSLTATNSSLSGQHRAFRDSWLDLGVLFSNSKWNFLGVSAYGGITIEEAHSTYLPNIISANPDYCTVMLGQNSLSGDFTISEQNTLEEIYTDLMNEGITPILITNVPSTSDAVNLRLNRWIRNKAEQYGVPLFDAWSHLVDPATGTYKSGLTSDGTHLSPQGAYVLGSAFAEFTNHLLGDYSGTKSRLIQSANDDRPGGSNGLLISHSGGYPAFWTGITAGTPTIESSDIGNIFKAEKTSSSTRFQVNCNEITLPGSGIRTYRLSALIGADVESTNGSWTLEILDVTNSYNILGIWENIPFDIEPEAVMSARFRTASNTSTILLVIKVMGGPDPFAESGGVGATFSIGQVTYEQII